MGVKYEHYMELMLQAQKRGDYAEAEHYLSLAGFFRDEPEEGQGTLPFCGDKPPV